jgi:hypothetical protein
MWAGDITMSEAVMKMAGNAKQAVGDDAEDIVRTIDGKDNAISSGNRIHITNQEFVIKEFDLFKFGPGMLLWIMCLSAGCYSVTTLHSKVYNPEIGVASILCCLYCWSLGGCLVFFYPIDEAPVGSAVGLQEGRWTTFGGEEVIVIESEPMR